MPRVLITGATGFIGKSLCERALLEGWQVRGIIRCNENAAFLPPGIDTMEIKSIDQYTDWTKALVGMDTIVHLAARVHVIHDTAANPLAAFREVNVIGTERFTRMAVAAGVKRLIYISSIKVNGEESINPYTELDSPNPQDAYAVSKWEAEQILRKIASETSLESVILRPPLVYGPGVKANFLQLIRIVNRGIPLPLSGINNSRSLIYLGNLIDAIISCINRPEAAGQTYLVSDGIDVSTPELIRRVAMALGKTARLLPCPTNMMRLAGKLIGKSAEMERLLGSLTIDPSKIRRDLGWRAPYTMDHGLRETAVWFLKTGSESGMKSTSSNS
jgi:nucleoside-diphosphate-sugar epimerase